MPAGDSAVEQGQLFMLEAQEHRRLAEQAERQARNYFQGALGERTVAGRVRALSALGWRVLEDRLLPGGGNVDLLLVGPGGLVVVDAKQWTDVEVSDGVLLSSGLDCTAELAKVRRQRDRVVDALARAGVAEQAVHAVLAFVGTHIDARLKEVRLVSEGQLSLFVTSLPLRLLDTDVPRVERVLDLAFRPASRFGARRRRDALCVVSQEALLDEDELRNALLARALEGPIEAWMTFLHPEQNKVVQAEWNGPARIRGPAGTGKTVVGLHRAARLARRGHRVVVVSYVKTLPLVLGGYYARLAPDTLERLVFRGVHQLAHDVVTAAGQRLPISPSKAESAFARAWLLAGRGTVLERLDARPTYWKEEIDHVIKGRGLETLSQYADLQRAGRGTAMRVEHRAVMWDVFKEYQSGLAAGEACDFNDLLLAARNLLRSGAVRLPFDAVVVDEVQDLSLVGLQLLHAIVGDAPNGLLLIGDGQQSVYPGGFRLSEAGISVAGRAHVFTVNYRNTRQILEHALSTVSGDDFDDLETFALPGGRDVIVTRTGEPPLVVHASERRSIDEALVAHLLRANLELGVRFGDMAVLAASRREVDRLAGVLRRERIGTVHLEEYDGQSSDLVRLGTYKRAKGLEFKCVFLPDLRTGDPRPWQGESMEAYEERAARLRREEFVAMTRARDRLWLGYLPS